MKIEWHEGLTRFLVWSETKPDQEPYLVDLEENLGIGCCSCDDFRCHKQPAILGKDKSETARESKRCKHILHAREFLGRHLVDTLIRTNLHKNKQNQERENQ